jgi:23S rRNA (cytidine2498-2'-O)-methyltransferase
MQAFGAAGLYLPCRAGFEPECAAEISERAAVFGVGGYAKTERDSGYVRFLGLDAESQSQLCRALPWHALIFARQRLSVFAELQDLDPKDRLGPVLDAMAGSGRVFGQLGMEHPDADVGRDLAGLARSFGNALRAGLRKPGHLSAKDDPRKPTLHVVLLSGTHLLLAAGDAEDTPPRRGSADPAAPWSGGIPRLKLARDAPSRSALKLEEALLALLSPEERARWMKAGQQAVDLGAAPGGWSWVLARAGLQVTAIDNGPLAESALGTGLIKHLRSDGFRWRPPHPIDWLVCDMVEQPKRVAALMGDWLVEGDARRAIFNLKLPMKKRWDETRLCLDLFAAQAGAPLEIRARQLYHDREEITVYAGPRG